MADQPRLNWFPFYWQDFLGSDKVQNMTNEEVGIYLKLLIRQFDKGSIPCQSHLWTAFTGCQSQSFHIIEKVLSQCFVKRKSCWINVRMAKIKKERLHHYQALSKAGKQGGEAKAQGKPGSSEATSQATARLKQETYSTNSTNQHPKSEVSEVVSPPHPEKIKKAAHPEPKNATEAFNLVMREINACDPGPWGKMPRFDTHTRAVLKAMGGFHVVREMDAPRSVISGQFTKLWNTLPFTDDRRQFERREESRNHIGFSLGESLSMPMPPEYE